MKLKNYIVPIYTLILLCFLLAGCRYTYVEKPERLLSEKEMAEVISEFAHISALEDNNKFQEDSLFSKIGKGAFIERIYKKYGINKTILEQNNLYYSQSSKKYIRIYELALGEANKLIDNEAQRLKAQDEAIAQAREKLISELPEGAPIGYSSTGANADPYLNRETVENSSQKLQSDSAAVQKIDKAKVKKITILKDSLTVKDLGPFYPDTTAQTQKKIYGPIPKQKTHTL